MPFVPKPNPRFPVMRKEVKQRFIRKLEMYEGKLSTMLLRTSEKQFSVLGLLCDLAVEDDIGMWVAPTDHQRRNTSLSLIERIAYTFRTDTEQEKYFLPKEVKEWAGVYDCTLRTYEYTSCIVSLQSACFYKATPKYLIKMLEKFKEV